MLCSKCGKVPRRRGQQWCNSCFSDHQRAWNRRRKIERLAADLTEDELVRLTEDRELHRPGPRADLTDDELTYLTGYREELRRRLCGAAPGRTADGQGNSILRIPGGDG